MDASRKEKERIKADNESLIVALEGSRAEADGYREYYSRWEATQKQLEETTKALHAAIEERDESRRALEGLQSVHESSLQNSKKRETAMLAAHQAKMDILDASAKQDFAKIKKMKAEIVSLKKRLEGKCDDVEGKVDKENMLTVRETEMDARSAAGLEQRAKRNYDDAFPDPDSRCWSRMSYCSLTDYITVTAVDGQHPQPDGNGKQNRHLLSDNSRHNSRHNSPSSRRINKRPNLRHDTSPASPFRADRVQEPVYPTGRVLARETQSDDEHRETQETIPLDFDDVKDEAMDTSQFPTRHDHIIASRPLVIPRIENRPSRTAKGTTDNANRKINEAPRMVNLHDKTNFVPLVSPDSETTPTVVRPHIAEGMAADGQVGEVALAVKGDGVKDEQNEGAKKELDSGSTTKRNSDKTSQLEIKREPSQAKTQIVSVTLAAKPVKAEGDIKHETPLGSRVGSRSTTPAPGSVDKRKLLPIPGWKGGRSSRALARRDSFEDDDGSVQPSVRTSTGKHAPTSTLKPRDRHEDSPLQTKRYTRPTKHVAIPAHMATEMTRSRTTDAHGSSDQSPRTVGVKRDVVHSDPVQEQSRLTPLVNRDRNVRRTPGPTLSKDVDAMKRAPYGASRRMSGTKAEEKGLDGDRVEQVSPSPSS